MTTQNLPDYGWTESNATGTTMRVAPFLDQSLSRFADGEPLRIIDLGCGNGRLISLLQGFERTWVGIDPALSGIETQSLNMTPHRLGIQVLC